MFPKKPIHQYLLLFPHMLEILFLQIHLHFLFGFSFLSHLHLVTVAGWILWNQMPKQCLGFKRLIHDQHLWNAEEKLNCKKDSGKPCQPWWEVWSKYLLSSELCLIREHSQAFLPLSLSLGLWAAPGRHEFSEAHPALVKHTADQCGYLLSAPCSWAAKQSLFECHMSLLTRVAPPTQDCVFLTIHVTQAVLSYGTTDSSIYRCTGAHIF